MEVSSFILGVNEIVVALGGDTPKSIIFVLMEKYYRHFNGGLYRFIGLAKDSETQEEFVVYQGLSGEKQMWVRPAAMFYGKVARDGCVMNRFQEIGENEIPPTLNPKYHFPDINYTNEKFPLTLGEFSKSVQRMITILLNRNIVLSSLFQGLKSDDELEREALRRIMEYRQGDDLESIFHLIQAWGGKLWPWHIRARNRI